MKTKSYLALFVGCAAAFSSCESAIDNFMVDDTVAFLNGGLVTTNVYLGLDDPTEVYVLKSGKGFQGATVDVTVDESVLAEYNVTAKTPVRLLPADCYTIRETQLSLSAQDYRKPFVIEWNRDRLAAVLQSDASVAIPLRMTVEGEDVNTDPSRMTTLIQPKIDSPLLYMNLSGLQTGLMPTRRSPLEEVVYMTVSTNFIPKSDIDFTLSVDAEALVKYNADNGTAYKLLPSEAYDIQLDGWSIKKNVTSNRYKFTFLRNALIPESGPSKFGDYILPIRVSSESAPIDESKSLLLYKVSVVAQKIDKSLWSVVSCNSDVRTVDNWEKVEGDYLPDYLIDGTINTHWRSVWSVEQDLPVEVVVDMGVERDLYRFSIEAPTSTNRKYFNSKSGYVAVADAPEGPWTNLADWIYPAKGTTAYEFDLEPATARYFKFVIEEPFDTKVYWKMAISELSVWGE